MLPFLNSTEFNEKPKRIRYLTALTSVILKASVPDSTDSINLKNSIFHGQGSNFVDMGPAQIINSASPIAT